MGHVHLHVSYVGEAAAFHHEALGFHKIAWLFFRSHLQVLIG